mmetsp:Transcript_4760/g.7188  ORF Transcript_4760/g.7188 Transcript_4760/m.7188 type:complete len:106 (-) Transcript_4760:388-705(-)
MGNGKNQGPKLTSHSNQFSVVQTSQESIIGAKELDSETAKVDNADINDSIGLGGSIGPEFKNSVVHGVSKQEFLDPVFGRNPATQATQQTSKGKRRTMAGSIGLN